MLPRCLLTVSMTIGLYYPACTPTIQATLPERDASIGEFWSSSTSATGSWDVASRDTLWGPWGAERAPDPRATYTLIERKQHGTNPGIVVRDPQGREWHVKQPPHTEQGAEGPVEVVLSRVLSAVGYHQPPVYFLPSLTVRDGLGTHVEPGGRFRLTDSSIKAVGTWSWQRNPFVGTQPYQGLLVILMMFGSSDIKNENNVLYERAAPGDGPRRWYVVRDLGTALGETGRFAPRRGDPDIFDRQPFILGIENGFVRFDYHGWHQELVRRLAPEDVSFAVSLLEQLSDRQWDDAFQAGGYPPPTARRFIATLRRRLAKAHATAS